MQEESLWPKVTGGWERAKGNGETWEFPLAPESRLKIKNDTDEKAKTFVFVSFVRVALYIVGLETFRKVRRPEISLAALRLGKDRTSRKESDLSKETKLIEWCLCWLCTPDLHSLCSNLIPEKEIESFPNCAELRSASPHLSQGE